MTFRISCRRVSRLFVAPGMAPGAIGYDAAIPNIQWDRDFRCHPSRALWPMTG